MSKIVRLFTLVCSLLLAASALPAQVTLSITFSPVLASGADPEGFASSTWTMSFEVETYNGTTALAHAEVADGTLTVSGSTSLDGNYTITSQSGGFAFFPYIGTLGFAVSSTPSYGPSTFSFGGVTVSDFLPTGTPLIDFFPARDSPVLVSHFHGASVATTTIGSFVVNNGSDTSRYSIANTPISVSAVPEPGTYAAVVGLLALGFAATRRRPRQSPNPTQWTLFHEDQ